VPLPLGHVRLKTQFDVDAVLGNWDAHRPARRGIEPAVVLPSVELVAREAGPFKHAHVLGHGAQGHGNGAASSVIAALVRRSWVKLARRVGSRSVENTWSSCRSRY
jgi:hypothetical protein